MRTLPFILLLTLGLCHGLFAMEIFVGIYEGENSDGTPITRYESGEYVTPATPGGDSAGNEKLQALTPLAIAQRDIANATTTTEVDTLFSQYEFQFSTKGDMLDYLREHTHERKTEIALGLLEGGLPKIINVSNKKVNLHIIPSYAGKSDGYSSYVDLLANDPNNPKNIAPPKVTIPISPNPGYLFTGWSGDTLGSANPLTLTLDANKTIFANFAPDLNDTDEDGLSNYAELVTYGTDKTKADTDEDGLGDKTELDAGGDPKTSDAAYIDAVLKHFIDAGLQPGSSSSSTPFVHGWFYYPNRGWMWTNRTSYPYFYDSSTKAWMYFRSGEDKPRFYHYGTKAWVTLGE